MILGFHLFSEEFLLLKLHQVSLLLFGLVLLHVVKIGFHDLAEGVLLHRIVLDLLRHVKVHCVIVGREFVPLKELDGRLVQLQHDDLMQQGQTLNVLLS